MTIIEAPGRIQPFAVWRGREILYFSETLEVAEAFIERQKLGPQLPVTIRSADPERQKRQGWAGRT